VNKNFFKQFAIALALFLLGYFTFNSKLFAAEHMVHPAIQISIDAIT
jgi:NitT/TauT family transport system substrate-binding protein